MGTSRAGWGQILVGLSATDSHDQEETTEMRKGDARAVRMSCMSNIYLFIIQH